MLVLAAAREELGDLAGEIVGVGPVPAGVCTAVLLERLAPSGVVLIGTAGAYPGGPPIGPAIAASRVGLSDGVAAMGLGYVPRPPPPVECDAALLARLGLPTQAVLTTGAITTDAGLARRLADGWTVEHLEAYAVGFACRAAGIPFVAVLGITNAVGPDAHAEWLTWRDAAQEAARRAIAPLLSSSTHREGGAARPGRPRP
jgi:purine-nucleoside phosphorylase